MLSTQCVLLTVLVHAAVELQARPVPSPAWNQGDGKRQQSNAPVASSPSSPSAADDVKAPLLSDPANNSSSPSGYGLGLGGQAASMAGGGAASRAQTAQPLQTGTTVVTTTVTVQKVQPSKAANSKEFAATGPKSRFELKKEAEELEKKKQAERVAARICKCIWIGALASTCCA